MNQVLRPPGGGRYRSASSLEVASSPQGPQRRPVTVRPPIGRMVLMSPTVSGAEEPFLTCTPNCRPLPSSSEHWFPDWPSV